MHDEFYFSLELDLGRERGREKEKKKQVICSSYSNNFNSYWEL